MKHIVIVDFASTEVCRASFSYDGYLLYASLKDNPDLRVTFMEEATAYKLYQAMRFEHVDEYIFHLWSYSQIEFIKWAKKTPQLSQKKMSIIGYKPFADLVNLPFYADWSDAVILDGIKKLPEIYDEMQYGLYNDCDNHIDDPDTRDWRPIFMSYGCPNKCAFCPIVPNRADRPDSEMRINIPLEDTQNLVDALLRRGNNIHFLDEDFFLDMDYAKQLIDYMIEYQKAFADMGEQPFKWIALASIKSFAQYLKEEGEDKLVAAGFFLVELGLEAKNAKVRKEMNKTGDESDLMYIIKKSPHIKKFWLSITFFPGETITSIRDTGLFLQEYGIKYDENNDRLVTNGNIGGLGQFFQPYYGTAMYDKLGKIGKTLEGNPIRLIPSFIPNTFLSCVPKQISVPSDKELRFFDVYSLEVERYLKIVDGVQTVGQFCDALDDSDVAQFCVFVALMARFGHIIEREFI